MQYVVIDTETTGIYDSDDIIQLSQFICDEDLKIKSWTNDYFLTDKAISPSVTNVTGLNRRKLTFLSNNEYFEDKALEYLRTWNQPNTVIIGHNIATFDMRIINANLERHGYPRIDVPVIDTMRRYRDLLNLTDKRGNAKYPKLGELYKYVLDRFKMTEEEAKKMFEEEFKVEAKAHNALYDIFMTYFSYYLLR